MAAELLAAEIYVPFSWFEAMWLENLGFCAEGEGWKAVDRGDQKFGRQLPTNPSGGVLCANPIGASGMLRLSEAARQVMGRADAQEVEHVGRALTPGVSVPSSTRGVVTSRNACSPIAQSWVSRVSWTSRRLA